jgi:CheY-like chemotaxis protein
MVQLSIVDMLESLGHTVVANASRLPEAMRLARKGDFDFAVLDLDLMGESSVPVADALRGRDIPFIFATAFAYGLHLGNHFGAPVIDKPFHRDRLEAAMERALRLRQPFA